jgi:hypothetical protein
MGKRGPKLKITPELIKKIAKAVEVGTPYKYAARHAGISPDTFDAWYRRGRGEAIGPYHDFYEAIEQANSGCIVGCLTSVRVGRQGWQGSAWILERRFKQEFGRHLVLENIMTADEKRVEDAMIEFRKTILPTYQPRNAVEKSN